PNQLFKDWLTKHYSMILSEALAEVRRPGTSVLFVAEGTSVTQPPPEPTAGLEDFELEPPPIPAAVPATAPGGLNPRYTFDTFIVGPSNQFAHAACRAVAEA